MCVLGGFRAQTLASLVRAVVEELEEMRSMMSKRQSSLRALLDKVVVCFICPFQPVAAASPLS